MQNWNDDPAVTPETPNVTEVSFIADMDHNDVPITGGVEISFCYFMRYGVAVVSKSEVDYDPHYVPEEHVYDEIKRYLDTEVEFIK